MPRRNLTFPVSVDPARVINGAYQFDNGEMADIDAQILVLQAKALATVTSPTPTGTGFRHVTAGVEDGASALVVNADVNASAAIAGSKLAANLVITTSVAAGTTPATTGAFRCPNTDGVYVRNAANTGNVRCVSVDAGDNINVGDATASNIVSECFGSGIQYFRFSGNDVLALRGTDIRAIKPITGEDSFYATPYGVHGTGTVAEGDATRTEVAGIYKFTHIIYTGAMTAGRTVTFPLPGSLGASYHKTVFNNTTGGFAITLANGGGAVFSIAAGKTAMAAFEPSGVRRLTADV